MIATPASAYEGHRVCSPVVLGTCAAAAFGFVIAYLSMRGPDRAGDFYAWYVAAQALLRGLSPYEVIPAIDPQRFQTPFFYPLPAAILTVPFAWLPYALAGALFVALSSALLCYALAREGTHRLWVFASAPFIVAAASGHWSTMIAAAALLPALGFLAAVKPNVGLATFFFRPTRWLVVGSALLMLVSLAIRPAWPAEWLRGLGAVQDRVIPMLTPVGPLLLLAVSRWRRPETRLLLGYACVPQAPWFYDQVVLWLIPATALQAINYTAASQLALFVWIFANGLSWGKYGSWALAFALYLPPLIMILRRPNEGEIPGWAERWMGRVAAQLGCPARSGSAEV